MNPSTAPALEVLGLSVCQQTPARPRVVDGLDVRLVQGEMVALVGESGSGKTASVLGMLGLLPSGLEIDHLEHMRLGQDEVDPRNPTQMRSWLGTHLAWMGQDPLSCLNPVLTVEAQLTEGPRVRLGVNAAEARAQAVELLTRVGLSDAAKRLHDHPHQLSGGMRQRVALAAALSCRPRVLLADEPTSALDVTVQAQVVSLLRDACQHRGLAVLLITHDLSLAGASAKDLLVMYAGRTVESGPCDGVLRQPAHPYTRGLKAGVPPLATRLPVIPAMPGSLPAPGERPPGCAFHPRCPAATDQCRREDPAWQPAPHGGSVRCFHPLEGH